jgi:hypothetical protein
MPKHASIWPNSHAITLSGIPDEMRRRSATLLCQNRMSAICIRAYSHVMMPTTRSFPASASGGVCAPSECHTHTTRPANSASPSRTLRSCACRSVVSHS